MGERLSAEHTVAVRQFQDGWQAICAACSWRYTNTSPWFTEQAAWRHESGKAQEEAQGDG